MKRRVHLVLLVIVSLAVDLQALRGDPKELFVLEGHSGLLTGLGFSPDGKILATLDSEHLRLWDSATGKLRRTIKDRGWTLQFTPDGKQIIVGGGGVIGGYRKEQVKMWSVDDGALVATFEEKDNALCGVSLSPDGKTLASGTVVSKTGKVTFWDVEPVRQKGFLEAMKADDFVGKLTSCIVHSPDGKLLARAEFDFGPGRINVWDLETKKEKLEMEGGMNILSFSPDSKTLAIIGGRKYSDSIALLDLTSQKVVELKGHTKFVFSISFRPDNKFLASASHDQSIKIWELASNKCVRSITNHSKTVTAVAFNSSGSLLASGSLDGTARVWDVRDILADDK